jgi:hypothetical protein
LVAIVVLLSDSWSVSSLSSWPAPGLVDQLADRVDVVVGGRLRPGARFWRWQRVTRPLGGLRFGVERLAGPAAVGLERRPPPVQLLHQHGFDLLGALQVAAEAMAAPELAGEQGQLPADERLAERAVGLARREQEQRQARGAGHRPARKGPASVRPPRLAAVLA